MTCGGFKDLPRGTIEEKILCDKESIFAKTVKYDWYQRGLVSIVYKFFVKNDCFPCK